MTMKINIPSLLEENEDGVYSDYLISFKRAARNNSSIYYQSFAENYNEGNSSDS